VDQDEISELAALIAKTISILLESVIMKITRNHLTFGFLAVVAVLAVFALAGHPLLPVDALAGLGMLPMAMSGEIDMKEIKTLIEVQGAALEKFKKTR
jgi:hypothetical protein